MEASVHKETKSPSAEGRWAKRSDSREKNARRRWEERWKPACKRRQNPRRQRGDGQSGVTAGKKMHAGDRRKGGGRRAQGDKIPAGSIETAKPEEKWKEKCTPGSRGKAGANVHMEGNCPPASSKRPSRRRNGKKNARWRGEEQQGPACTRR